MTAKTPAKRVIWSCIAVLLVIALLIGAFFLGKRSGKNTVPRDEATHYLPNVTAGMSDPDYWAEKQSGPDKVLLTKEEISARNDKILKTESSMHDMRSYPTSVDAEGLQKKVAEDAEAVIADFLSDEYYTEEGKKVAASDFSDISTRLKEIGVRYAVAVCNGAIRSLPTDDRILDAPDLPNLDNVDVAGTRVGDPVIILGTSQDGDYYYVNTLDYEGWMDAEDLAVCKDRTEWLQAWDIPEEELLVVTTDKIRLETSRADEDSSGLLLGIGTRLREAEMKSTDTAGTRSSFNNYAVVLPTRAEDGTYKASTAFLSEHESVNRGFLPLTKRNIAAMAFSMLGNTYGWSSSLDSEDCSGFIQGIYRCFGLYLPRDTSKQSVMTEVKNTDLTNLTKAEKTKAIRKLPLGTALYMKGHTVLYLGEVNGRLYAINSSWGSRINGAEDSQQVNSIVVCDIDTVAKKDGTYLDLLTSAVTPYES